MGKPTPGPRPPRAAAASRPAPRRARAEPPPAAPPRSATVRRSAPPPPASLQRVNSAAGLPPRRVRAARSVPNSRGTALAGAIGAKLPVLGDIELTPCPSESEIARQRRANAAAQLACTLDPFNHDGGRIADSGNVGTATFKFRTLVNPAFITDPNSGNKVAWHQFAPLPQNHHRAATAVTAAGELTYAPWSPMSNLTTLTSNATVMRVVGYGVRLIYTGKILEQGGVLYHNIWSSIGNGPPSVPTTFDVIGSPSTAVVPLSLAADELARASTETWAWTFSSRNTNDGLYAMGYGNWFFPTTTFSTGGPAIVVGIDTGTTDTTGFSYYVECVMLGEFVAQPNLRPIIPHYCVGNAADEFGILQEMVMQMVEGSPNRGCALATAAAIVYQRHSGGSPAPTSMDLVSNAAHNSVSVHATAVRGFWSGVEKFGKKAAGAAWKHVKSFVREAAEEGLSTLTDASLFEYCRQSLEIIEGKRDHYEGPEIDNLISLFANPLVLPPSYRSRLAELRAPVLCTDEEDPTPAPVRAGPPPAQRAVMGPGHKH